MAIVFQEDMKIRFVALISRENRPLYIQQFPQAGEEDANEMLKYNFLSHMALDVFESSFGPNTNARSTLLFVDDGVYVFGMEMLTGLKVVVGCTKGPSEERDVDLTATMNAIKVEYVKVASNPFFKETTEGPEGDINSSRLDAKVREIVNGYNV